MAGVLYLGVYLLTHAPLFSFTRVVYGCVYPGVHVASDTKKPAWYSRVYFVVCVCVYVAIVISPTPNTIKRPMVFISWYTSWHASHVLFVSRQSKHFVQFSISRTASARDKRRIPDGVNTRIYREPLTRDNARLYAPSLFSMVFFRRVYRMP
jgi:hypothetical protein